jgi:hypothetical protein
MSSFETFPPRPAVNSLGETTRQMTTEEIEHDLRQSVRRAIRDAIDPPPRPAPPHLQPFQYIGHVQLVDGFTIPRLAPLFTSA